MTEDLRADGRTIGDATERPTVSVVIATRNRPQMLRVALDAVTDQTYDGPIECIVVFDQAEPDFGLQSDAPQRSIRVCVNDSRAPGLAGARNTGILSARGSLIAFCDDDDFWHPDKLARQVATLGEALTSVSGIVIDYGGRQVERVPDASTFTLKNLIRNRLMEAHPSTVLMRRDALLDEIGLVDEEIPGSFGEDFDFIIRAVQAGTVSVLEEPLVTVRWGQSMFSRDWATIIAAIDYLMDKHELFRRDRRALARLFGQRAFANAGLHNSRESLHDSWRAIRSSLTEKRAYLSIPVALRLISAERVLDLAHRRGRGI